MKFSIAFPRITVLATCCALVACGSSGSDGSGQPDRGNGALNSPPALAGTPPTVAVIGEEYLFEPSASDADGDTLTYGIINRPEWATYSPTTGRLRGVPTADARPTYTDIQISVTDGKETVSLPAFSLTVQQGSQPPGNSPPTITGTPSASVVAGNAYSFAPVATDPDGQVLAYSIVNRPTWAQFDTVTGRLSGTPGANQVGVYSGITISVSDGTAHASLPAFDLTVTGGTAPGAGNRAPTISGTPAAAVTVGQAYSFRPTATDPDGQSLTFSISNAPAWANFNPATGELSGTPGAAQVGQTTNIVISVSDGQASASLPAFGITVLAVNAAPRISGTPPTSVTVGQAYSFTPSASDADAGQTLTFSIVNRPSWAAFNSATGRLSGTPAAAGTFSNIVVSVSDGAATATLPAFTITVTAANRAPVISGTPTTSVTAGQAYSFTPTASDPDSGQTLTFSIANRPNWADFDPSSGRLAGTPTDAHAGSHFGITISVSDGIASTSLPSFGIAVAQSTATAYFNSSFETGDKTEWNQSAFGAGTMTVANSGVAFNGTHYLRAAMVTGSPNSNSLFHDYGAPGQVSTQFRDYWFQFAVSVDAFTGPWVTNKIAYVQQYDSSQGDTSFSNAFRDFQQIIAVDSSGRYFVELADIPSWRFIALSQNTGNGTNHGPTAGWWDVLRMQVVLDTVAGGEVGVAGASSGTTSGNGIVRLWKNGTLILEYTNLNLTKATPTVAAGRILLTPHNAGSWAGGNTNMYWDDVRLTSDATLLPAMPGGPVPRTN